ncbi:UNKNOWN [Stylonychia lemnae]|uniref:Uncharacterized protein n=1 Tax=Stylonychia lemnae TaxID=5949 RepID=A0A078AIP8_STYLE|nr:UNKNOWN [Stylonychia lemnae]|eukprot:CDW82094.1 UNKNOWN [Stylonychia lemnae]
MNKLIVLAALLSVNLASKNDFPSFDALHANCALKVTYKGQTCDTVLPKIESVIKSFTPEPESKGLYAIKEDGSDYVWSTRTTPTHHYVDDIIFETDASNGDCVVESKSRSESLSYYDYETNYCNMWAVHNVVGGFTDVTPSDCKFIPTDPVTRCAVY